MFRWLEQGEKCLRGPAGSKS